MIDNFATAQEQASSRAGTLGQVLSHARFRLVAADGRYLHMLDLTMRTADKNFAWIGTQQQLAAVRRLHPETKAMRAVRVPPPSVNKTAIW